MDRRIEVWVDEWTDGWNDDLFGGLYDGWYEGSLEREWQKRVNVKRIRREIRIIVLIDKIDELLWINGEWIIWLIKELLDEWMKWWMT